MREDPGTTGLKVFYLAGGLGCVEKSVDAKDLDVVGERVAETRDYEYIVGGIVRWVIEDSVILLVLFAARSTL